MMPLRFRASIDNYVRDSYLGSLVELNPAFPVIDCAIGSSQFGLSPKAVEAHMAHDVRRNAAYPELFYDTLLKPALLSRFGLSSQQAGQLFFGHGSFNLAERIIHKLAEPSLMLGVGPQFNEIPSEFSAAGGTYHTVPVTPGIFEFPEDALKRSITNEHPSIVYLDNPNNPLGRFVDKDAVARIARTAEEVGAIMLVDEAYGDFVPDTDSAITLVPDFTNLAVIRSFSKGLGLAAARVGYLVLSHQIAERYKELDVPFEPTLHSAELAHATLTDGEFIAMVRQNTSAAKQQVVQALQDVGFLVLPTHPGTSILSAYRDGDDLALQFSSVGISVEPGIAFRQTHPEWTNSYCRIRVPRESDVAAFVHRVTILKK